MERVRRERPLRDLAQEAKKKIEEDLKYVVVEVEYCYETKKAYLIYDGDTKEWIPKSQIRNIEEIQEREWEAEQSMSLELPEWLAMAKGLI